MRISSLPRRSEWRLWADGTSGTLFDGPEDQATPAPAWTHDYRLVDTPETLALFLDALREQPRFCLDTETTALDPLQAELVGLSFSWQEGVAYYLPVRGPAGSRLLDPDTVLQALRPILADPRIEKVGQNIKYDMLVLGRAGVELRRTDQRHDGAVVPARKRRTEPQP